MKARMNTQEYANRPFHHSAYSFLEVAEWHIRTFLYTSLHCFINFRMNSSHDVHTMLNKLVLKSDLTLFFNNKKDESGNDHDNEHMDNDDDDDNDKK